MLFLSNEFNIVKMLNIFKLIYIFYIIIIRMLRFMFLFCIDGRESLIKDGKIFLERMYLFK